MKEFVQNMARSYIAESNVTLYNALVGAENYLTELIGVKVDLVLKRSVRSELRDRIFGEAVTV